MAAYVVITREKTLDPAKLDAYRQVAPATFEQHPVMMLASHGRKEVVEGPPIDEILILEFASYDEAIAWYRSPEYQAAKAIRQKYADADFIIIDGAA